jgi:predicted amidophosphoribosyltransferase
MAYKKNCKRCHKSFYTAGEYCGVCAGELADEQYLDDGATYQGNEEADRKCQGEYADLNEGDEEKPEPLEGGCHDECNQV